MTKAQLIKENEALRNALRIVCIEPNSMEAHLIRGTEKHHVAIEKIVMAGDPSDGEVKKFEGFLGLIK